MKAEHCQWEENLSFAAFGIDLNSELLKISLQLSQLIRDNRDLTDVYYVNDSPVNRQNLLVVNEK